MLTMSEEDYKKLHPVLSEVTKTYVDLYTNRPNEENREKLIKLEALLHEKLETIQKAKNEQ
ncbi:hypothetical protein DXI23_08940 [Marinobacter flavimaris]|uniref:Uncharacterized protein n=2 Tax=Marinobacteraceae TaxID=2887365 RepID=A0A3D8H5C7_9GAMM|nr:hypothetical protein [Marinobacter sp.]MBW3227556.1 hypothetical protein [Marinobacter adhaerens]PPI80815.1 hypothetical protein MDHKLMBL_06560 [Marinobacter flavimaris]MCK5866257.1 hypothetical protein [Marinobacter adhaerens]PHS49099.1 MAG: hypothetical protein COB05_03605 [Marinobacter sp.]